MKKIPKWMYNVPIAHRGFFDALAPENSLKSFQQAIDRGFAIELDVQILKDQTLIVFHDEQLKRMTGVEGNLLDCTYDDIKDLRLLTTDEKIPTFKEVLECVNGQVPLMIEFKNKFSKTKLEALGYEQLKNYTGEYVIQSFNPISVNWFRKHAPHIIRGQLASRYKNKKMFFILKFVFRNVLTNIITKPDYVIYDIKGLETHIVHKLKKKGMPLFSYTAKSKLDYDYAMALEIPPCFEGFDPEA
ncbi:MAG: glycerophosphodiester phosphodiesterase [Clostridiales bacterium]|nr:glycerophosphodiester phosphodiesterase [Clostridiales bacterium]